MNIAGTALIFLVLINCIYCTDLLDEYVRHVEETNKYQQDTIKYTKSVPYKWHKRSLEATESDEYIQTNKEREKRDATKVAPPTSMIQKAFGNRSTLKKLIQTSKTEKKIPNRITRPKRSVNDQEVVTTEEKHTENQGVKLEEDNTKTPASTQKIPSGRKRGRKNRRLEHSNSSTTLSVADKDVASKEAATQIGNNNGHIEGTPKDVTAETYPSSNLDQLEEKRSQNKTEGKPKDKNSRKAISHHRVNHNRRKNKNAFRSEGIPKPNGSGRQNGRKGHTSKARKIGPSRQNQNKNKPRRVISSKVNRTRSSKHDRRTLRPKRSIGSHDKRNRDSVKHIPMRWTHSEVLDDKGEVVLKWQPRHQEIAFRLEAKTTGFAAVGFSQSGEVNGADMVIGWIDDNGMVSLVVS